ncbi:MAG: hypothetical protein JW795_01470, partial [Chitinivibrionales bacterium]|nr:hypothetical protein [Chitinivibrionales bacterium]
MISKKIIPFFLLGIFALFFQSYGRLEGFYKDVFQDEGTRIDGGNLQVDCKKIDFSQEHLNIGSGQNASESEITAQSLIMIKSDNDANGYLLYPDNAPRYALIYYHGGYMSHAQDLGEEGIKRVRTFYYNGGSEFGSCAGSFMLSTNSKWFSLWPGKMDGPSVSSTPIDKIINTSSPLIGYNGIKAGDIIPGVYHNNGGSVDTSKAPKGTKFCTMHNSGKLLG